MSSHSPVILASTSMYRQYLMKKLGIPFTAMKPAYDEEAAKATAKGKSPQDLAELLSRGKAESLQQKNQSAVIVAGDQLVNFQGKILGKSKNFENAFAQLKMMAGRNHELITAVTLMAPKKTIHLNHITKLKMKMLSDDEIAHYLKTDKPYDCAGSYKIEESGIALFSEIVCDDFTAIQGLPLLWLSNQFKEMGYELFKR